MPKLKVEIVDAVGNVVQVIELSDPREEYCRSWNEHHGQRSGCRAIPGEKVRECALSEMVQ